MVVHAVCSTSAALQDGPLELLLRMAANLRPRTVWEGEERAPTWSLRAVMAVTRSICRRRREGCLHRRSSSYRTSWGGWSPSARSRSPGHPAPDQTPGEKAVGTVGSTKHKGSRGNTSSTQSSSQSPRGYRQPHFLPFPEVQPAAALLSAFHSQGIGKLRRASFISFLLGQQGPSPQHHGYLYSPHRHAPDTNPLRCSHGSSATSGLGRSE